MTSPGTDTRSPSRSLRVILLADRPKIRFVAACRPRRTGVNGGNEEQNGPGPLWGARGGDRCALALISLALDEVDATEVLRRHGESGEPSVVVDVLLSHHCERRRLGGNATAAIVSGASQLGRPGRSQRRRCARQLRGGRDDRSRGMQSSYRRPGCAEQGGAISQDRASTRSSFRGRAGLSERTLTPMGAGGDVGCATGDEQVSRRPGGET